jgi:hypothetical protein
MRLDNPEIVRLLGMGLTWEQIQREAERRKLEYQRPCCAGCGTPLDIPEVVRDAVFCSPCEKKEQAAREEEKRLEDEEAGALLQVVGVARFLPVPLLIPVGLAVAAVAGLSYLVQGSRRKAA